MKRILAVLSILVLIMATALDHAACRIYGARGCTAKAALSAECGHAAKADGSGRCRGGMGEVACRAEKACPNSEETNVVTDCSQKPDCPSRCNRLVPGLLADRPNRTISLSPDAAESRIVDLPIDLISTGHTEIPDEPPPWGIHPGIATTVLRI